MEKRAWLMASFGLVIVSAIACVDLFHSTNAPTLCDLDASAPGCDGAVPTLCAADAGVAQSMALRACAWLSACEHPVGQNATGACMVDAILAFDCVANPNRQPKAKALAFWRCMQAVTTCRDVAACVMPDGIAGCTSGGYIGCTQGPQNPDTRFDCVAPTVTDAGTEPAPGENCAMHGQTCDSLDRDASNHGALCVGPYGHTCTTSAGCDMNSLSVCDDAGIDHGVDCTQFGGAMCTFAGASPACSPESTTSLPASNDVTCTPGNVQAIGSVTGQKETIDCTAISGSGTCNPIEGGAPGTVPSDACYVDGGCTGDTCDGDGGSLVACIRGRSLVVDCTALGLETCNPIATEEGTVASCNPLQ